MQTIELCDTCGVPRSISQGLSWNDNGVINLSLTPLERMVFYEAETIDHLFKGIEDLIGLPVEHIVIESRRRNTRKLMEKPSGGKIEESRRLAEKEKAARDEGGRQLRRKSTMKLRLGLNLQASDLGRVYGYGSVELGPPGMLKTSSLGAPRWSANLTLVFYAGDQLGTVEAFEQSDMRITYEEVDEDAFRFSAYQGTIPSAWPSGSRSAATISSRVTSPSSVVPNATSPRTSTIIAGARRRAPLPIPARASAWPSSTLPPSTRSSMTWPRNWVILSSISPSKHSAATSGTAPACRIVAETKLSSAIGRPCAGWATSPIS